jgi:hypothetical protein
VKYGGSQGSILGPLLFGSEWPAKNYKQ